MASNNPKNAAWYGGGVMPWLLPDAGVITYVNSAARGALDTNDGLTPGTALLTVDHAMAHCSGVTDDYIIVLDHDDDTETYPIVCDVDNAHIIGQPNLVLPRPRFRIVGDADGFDITAGHVEIAGLRIETAANTDTNNLIHVNGASAHGFNIHHNHIAWLWWAYNGLYCDGGASDGIFHNNYCGAHGWSNYGVYLASAGGRIIVQDNVFILNGYQTGVRCVHSVSENHCVVNNNQFMVPGLADGEAISFMGETNMADGNTCAGPQIGFGAFNPYHNTLDNLYQNSWGLNYAGVTPTLPVVS